jgi:hypothetical protein
MYATKPFNVEDLGYYRHLNRSSHEKKTQEADTEDGCRAERPKKVSADLLAPF